MYSDHPRGCGAHSSRPANMIWNPGSSPRVRGSLVGHVWEWIDFGIIPAGAGLTISPFVRYIASRDHPRGCGAHMTSSRSAVTFAGSSPRVRGSPDGYGREGA